MPDQRRARSASPVVGVNVKHIDIAEVKKSVIQHAVTDNFFALDRNKAIACRHLRADKLTAFIVVLRDQIKRAKSDNVIFNGWADHQPIIPS
jgi:hypothetical protein